MWNVDNAIVRDDRMTLINCPKKEIKQNQFPHLICILLSRINKQSIFKIVTTKAPQ